MTEIILGIILGAGIVFIFIKRNKSKPHKKTEKDLKVEKIMDLFKEKERIQNDDVEELFGVSDSTTTRYLQKLEDEGSVVQKGEGRVTYYVKR